MIDSYYYNAQLEKAILAFSGVFMGIQVKTGKNGCEDIATMTVPLRYGSGDRVVEAIGGHNTQNSPHSLPMLSCYMMGMTLANERMHGVGGVDRRAVLEAGGVFPDDVKSIHRVMPVPYTLNMELSIYASNTNQLFQILEQILILFDYDLQLQFNDAPYDWGKITKMTLTGITNEENHPAGIDRRMLVWTLSFDFYIWLSPPMDVRQGLIREINIRIGDLDSIVLNEIDANGELVPFSIVYDVMTLPTIAQAHELGLNAELEDGPSDMDEVDAPDPGGSQTPHPGPA